MQSKKLLCETRTYTEKTYTHNHCYSQLILPLQGSLFIKTDKHELSLDENHLFLLPPKCYHSFNSDSINQFLVLDIPRENSLVLLEDTFKYEMHQVLDDRWKAIRYLLLEETRNANKRGLSDLVNYACNFLLDEARPISIQYIYDNFQEQISIDKLAAIENFNVSYYIEWFNKKTGMTPNVYIQKLRLEKAKEYLIDTDLSILMISQLVGYEQQSSLTRLFIKHQALSPSAYRKKYREMGKSSSI
ncbi:helix-turn-helix- domain containing protein, AraC type [Alkaliphilus metalliredigens QYMF]|uniref:Helix-turn-helix-domain containing protein, AraC type n=1 Tax=Alkaliphilus metalliredigens (strain QYMF) TaxID=293826 RepID=A6TLP2_ALKMQ|nr:AraC family transcriptional regulator [Alkaliphilus metalliredigens]ABR47110.1 helix-turn-helix- domain containing protein, AraC type [Alkaliphilus metalliredigens QYMF]